MAPQKKGGKTNDYITFRVGKEIDITPSLIITFDLPIKLKRALKLYKLKLFH